MRLLTLVPTARKLAAVQRINLLCKGRGCGECTSMRWRLPVLVLIGLILSSCSKAVRLEIFNSLPETCEIWASARIARILPNSSVRMIHPMHLDPSAKLSILYRGRHYYFDWNPSLQRPLSQGDEVFARICEPGKVRIWQNGKPAGGGRNHIVNEATLQLLKIADASRPP